MISFFSMALMTLPASPIFIYFVLFLPLLAAENDSPQNIETFFPKIIQVPLPPFQPPSPPTSFVAPAPSPTGITSSSGRSGMGRVATAVVATAASTLFLSAVVFFVAHRVSARRREKGDGGNGKENPYSGYDTRVSGDLFRPAAAGRQLKGIIVDENGLDVLYWRKLESGGHRKSGVRKEVFRGGDDEEEDDDGGGGGMSRRASKKYMNRVQETPLLTSDSLSSTHRHRLLVESSDEGSITLAPPPPPQLVTNNFASIAAASAVVVNKAPSPPPPPPSAALPVPPAVVTKALPPPPALAPVKTGGPPPPEDANVGRGSFQFNNELMEALFGYVATNRKPKSPTSSDSVPGQPNSGGARPGSVAAQTFILDPRKSQNTAIVLRSLAISRQEIMDALLDGHGLTADTLEKLTRVAPTEDEAARILDFAGNPTKLADAESFLFHVLKSFPSAFRRLDAMLFTTVYASELHRLKDSINTLAKACKELLSRGLFLKLLEAVLEAGNRLNAGTARGNAKAFKLAALRKLSEVKSTDGKTTLLHFVVEEVVRSEGKKCALNRSTSPPSSSSSSFDEKDYIFLGLPVVGGLSVEFGNVKKAAGIDHDFFATAGTALATRAAEVRGFVGGIPADSGGEGFVRRMREFLDKSEVELKGVREEEREVMEVVKKTYDYYQSGASMEKGFHPLQLFVIVKEFLAMVDSVCVDIARSYQQRKKKMGGNIGNGALPATEQAAGGSPEHKAAMRFPVLPAHFLSDHSKSSSDSDDEF